MVADGGKRQASERRGQGISTYLLSRNDQAFSTSTPAPCRKERHAPSET